MTANGTMVVRYAYDAWGNPVATTGTMANTLGKDNPFRYRGYYYDTETGFYYLNSRYYNPEAGRFLNADGLLDTSSAIGLNLFAYCGNDPMNFFDSFGNYKASLTAEQIHEIELSLKQLQEITYLSDLMYFEMYSGTGTARPPEWWNSNPNLTSPGYTNLNPFPQGQCTWYAWGRAYELTRYKAFPRGNAATWYNSTPISQRGQEPRSNSIMVLNGGADGYGHVVYIERWDPITNTIQYSEGNYKNESPGIMKKNTWEGFFKGRNNKNVLGFIYTN